MKQNQISMIFLVVFVAGLGLPAWGVTYKYDNLHRLTKVTYDDGTTIVYSYDASGNRSRYVVTVVADLDVDTDVDFIDFAKFASHWLETDCVYPDLCGDADFDWNSKVDLADLATFAENWLWQASWYSQ